MIRTDGPNLIEAYQNIQTIQVALFQGIDRQFFVQVRGFSVQNSILYELIRPEIEKG
jgi:hypothetical protein